MISVENCSPFPHLVFEKTGLRGSLFDVIVVAGTFDIVHGTPLAPANEQLPLVFADQYHGDPMSSSLRHEGDLVIAKKSADIHVVGHARPLGGRPRAEWPVSVRVGQVEKRLRVTGPRWWEHTWQAGWRMSAPEPTAEVSLAYELAYGGTVPGKGRGEEERIAYPPNPVGRGFFGPRSPDVALRHPAPQIEAWETPIADIGAHYPPEGLGPICRWWPPRLDKAGTYDATWESERFPDYPDDFDFAFYNSAHPGLIAPGYLEPAEPVSLEGMFVEGEVETSLPRLEVVAVLGDERGYQQPEALFLDTLSFDTDAQTARLVWRRAVPREWELASVVIGAIPMGSGAGQAPASFQARR